MTWPPPPPASDPWESQTIPPSEPQQLPGGDDAGETGGPGAPEPSAPDPQPFPGGWETPTGARVSPGPAEPPFPVPSFDPDWNVSADELGTEVAAAPEVPVGAPDPWETVGPESLGAVEPSRDHPVDRTEPAGYAEPDFIAAPAGDGWSAPSDPVVQPMAADLEPPQVATGWDMPGDVAQPTAGAPHDPRYQPRWQDADAPGAYLAPGPPPEYGPGEGQWTGLYSGPPPVVPRVTGRAIPLRSALIGGGALVALILVVALAVWLLQPSPAADDTAATTTSEPPPVDTEARDELLRAVPRGYGSQACEPFGPSGAATAQVSCGRNTDPGGPLTSTYTQFADASGLDAAFESLVGSSQVVVCPGRIQSPGPWRRNASPDQVSGTLLCALDDNRPVLTWSDVDDLMIGTVASGPGGPTFDELYTWWAAHS